jgi:hypothetical protein
MNALLQSLLSGYAPSTSEGYHRALREVIQHVALLGLWRATFFERAAFYGGTALRVFHGLPRYSEDMDFSLVESDPAFSLAPFAGSLVQELASFGFAVEINRKDKSAQRRIESAFLKTNTRVSMLHIGAPEGIAARLHRDAVLKVKLEVDIDPPLHAATQMQTVRTPIPFQVRLYDMPSLFAGKFHAVLCRSWKSGTKGRDFFDLVWFVGLKVPCNIAHLRARMIQSGGLAPDAPLDRATLIQMLHHRIECVSVTEAAHDVQPFLSDPHATALWSDGFFHETAEQILTVDD